MASKPVSSYTATGYLMVSVVGGNCDMSYTIYDTASSDLAHWILAALSETSRPLPTAGM